MDYFGADAGAAATLRSRLESGARLDGLQVSHRHADGRRQQVELHGSVLSDAQGHATGYVASARPLDADIARDGELRLLDALLQALPVPVFVLAGAAGAPARVQRGNGAAALWLGLRPAQLVELGFDELRARLPAELRTTVADAIAAADGDAVRPAGAGWEVHARRIDDPAPSAGDAPARWVLALVRRRRARRARPRPPSPNTNRSATPCRTTCVRRSASSKASPRS